MIFDKNAKRVRELERLLEKGKGVPETIKKRILELNQKGPEWWIDFWDAKGKRRALKVPGNTRLAAERLERRKKSEIERGEYNAPEIKKVKIEKIIDHYLESKPRLSSTRTLCKHIKRHIGNLYLNRLDTDPHILVEHFQAFPEPQWSDKYKWNYYVILKAAIQFWIKMKRLVMSNPCEIIPELTGMQSNTNIREETPTIDEYHHLIEKAVELKVDAWIIDLIQAVWESGLRIGEVLKWKCEDVCLRFEKDSTGNVTELPYFTTFITKQHRVVRKQIPMSVGLWEILKRVIANRSEGWVWQRRTAPYKELREIGLMEKAGLSKYRPFHDFRKSFKVAMKKRGMSQEFTKYLQGHATNSMDEYYTQFRRLDVQGAHILGYRDQIETKKQA